MGRSSKLEDFFEKRREQWKKESKAVIKTEIHLNALISKQVNPKNKPDHRVPDSCTR